MITPEEIAKKLSASQRRMLLSLPGDGTARKDPPSFRERVTLFALVDKALQPGITAQLASRDASGIVAFSDLWRATKLGLAVRKIVAIEDAAPEGQQPGDAQRQAPP